MFVIFSAKNGMLHFLLFIGILLHCATWNTSNYFMIGKYCKILCSQLLGQIYVDYKTKKKFAWKFPEGN